MKNFQDKRVLVTGAGSGIGRATASAFAAEGAQIIAVDLAEQGLRDTTTRITGAGGRCALYQADISDPQAMKQLADAVHAEHGALDVLVNNAGIGAAGRFLDTRVDTWDRVWAVNVKGVMLGCQAFLPAMIERGSGHIVNLASMAGYFASPEMPIYAASKFAVLGFSEALRGDLSDHGIGVTAICPGIVNTNIVATTAAEGSAVGWKEGAVDFYARRNYPPEKVARAIVTAVRRNRAVAPVTPEARAMYHIKRLFPGLARSIASRPLPFMQNS